METETGTAAPAAEIGTGAAAPIVVDTSGVEGAEPEPEDIIEKIFDKAFEIAKEKGIDTTTLNENELLDLLPPEETPAKEPTETDISKEENVEGEPTEGEPTEEPEVIQKDETTAEKEDGPPAETLPKELTEIEKLRLDLDTSNRNIEEMRSFQGHQASELGPLRQFKQTHGSLIDDLTKDPAFRDHMLNYYPGTVAPGKVNLPADFDPTNPDQLNQLMQQNIAAALRDKDNRTRANNVAANAQAQRTNLISQVNAGEQFLVNKGVKPEEAKKYITHVFQQLTSDIPGLIGRLQKAEGMESEIDAAYQKGAKEAIQKLNSNKKTVRTTSTSNNARIDKTVQDKSTDEMNNEEWNDYMTKLQETDPDKWEDEMVRVEKIIAESNR